MINILHIKLVTTDFNFEFYFLFFVYQLMQLFSAIRKKRYTPIELEKKYSLNVITLADV